MNIPLYRHHRSRPASYTAGSTSYVTSHAFRRLVLVTLAALFILVTIGAVVRTTDSGLGCPDWPLCHGNIVPLEQEHSTYIELSHRVVAGGVGILVAGVALAGWRFYRRQRWVFIPAVAALAALIFQAALGGVTVLTELPRWSVMTHLAVAQGIIALLVLVYVAAAQTNGSRSISGKDKVASLGRFPWVALVASLAVYGLIITGSYVANTTGATYICGDSWPLCRGELMPRGELEAAHMGHRMAASAVGLLVLATVGLAWRRRHAHPQLWTVSGVVLALFVAQVLVGAANMWSGFQEAVMVAHLSVATALWMGLALLTIEAFSQGGLLRPAPMSKLNGVGVLAGTTETPPPSTQGPLIVQPFRSDGTTSKVTFLSMLADHITLTKPRIIVLLLITAVGGMFLAAKGLPPASTTLWVMVGGAMAAGGANSINHALEGDIDGRMRRTRSRPVAENRIGPRVAMTQGVLLNVIAFVLMSTQVNLLSAALTMAATAFYVLVYTHWLKRTTPQNIVIGGAAGAVPPVAGWAAVTGSLDLPAVYLFAIIFFWTPPHFWALSLLLKDDYARAGIPMLPVVRGVAETTQSIFHYSLLLVALTLMFFVVPEVGWVYFIFALPLGCIFLVMAWRLRRSQGQEAAKGLYLYSLLYLALLFTGVMIDSAVSL